MENLELPLFVMATKSCGIDLMLQGSSTCSGCMDMPCFSFIFLREMTFEIFIVSLGNKTHSKMSVLLKEEFAPRRVNSFLQELMLIGKG